MMSGSSHNFGFTLPAGFAVCQPCFHCAINGRECASANVLAPGPFFGKLQVFVMPTVSEFWGSGEN